MKSIFPLTLAVAVSTLLISGSSLRADTDDRIESSAANSYTFKTTLKNDSIKTESKDGVVTLTGMSPKNHTNRWPKIPSPVYLA